MAIQQGNTAGPHAAWLRRLRARGVSPSDLLILGTSNAIGRSSFANKVTGMAGFNVHNLSVGGSSSAAGLYMLGLVPRTQQGLALIDYSINDTDIAHDIWGESRAAGFVTANLKAIAAHVRGSGYLPLVLLLPSQLLLAEPLLGQQLHREVCLAEGLNFIDVRALFLSSMKRGASPAALMRDTSHMSDPAGRLFAAFLMEIFDSLRERKAVTMRRRESAVRPRVILAEELFPQQALVRRSSSLRSGSYGCLRPGFVLDIRASADEEVVGVMVNAGAPGGTIRVRGDGGEVVRPLNFEWSGRTPPVYFSVFADLARPVAGGPNGVTIEIVSDACLTTEKTDHRHRPFADRESEIEIEGVVLVTRKEVVSEASVWQYPDLPLDLGELPEAARLEDGLAALRVTGP